MTYKYLIDDIKNYSFCPNLFKLKYGSDDNFHFYTTNNNIERYLDTYLQIKNCYDGNFNNDILSFNNSNDVWYKNCLVNVENVSLNISRLHIHSNKIILYYLCLFKYPRLEENMLIRAQIYCLNRLGLKVTSVRVICFNENYILHGNKIQATELFKPYTYVCDKNYKIKIKTEQLIKASHNFYETLKEMNDTLNNKNLLVKDCNRHCEFKKLCNHIENGDYFQNFLMTIERKSNLSLQENAIYQAFKKPPVYVDNKRLSQWLKQIEYPYYFLDFEWVNEILPWVKGQGLYNDYVFEYCLDVINSDGTHESYHFLQEELGNNIELVEDLIDKLKDKGTIFAYNGDAAEKMKLKQFARLYPQYSERIYKIMERIVSIDVPLNSGMIYHKDIKGSYTLKHIANVISLIDYSNGLVDNGLKAILIYRQWLKTKNPILKKELIKYCGLDSSSMIYLLKWYQTNVYQKED